MSTFATQELVERLHRDVAQVELVLRSLVCSDVDVVEQVGRHTLEAGGKRLRPAFVLMSARACNPDASLNRAVELGACLEMIHMATLIHDDVIDHAALRRGRPTAASVFGNSASILSGDVLLARAMTILAADGDLDIIRTVSAAVVEMAEGEALEVQYRDRFDLSIEEHVRVLDMKTARFVDCCCRVGAVAVGGSPAVVEALASYGRNLGLAFQIVDDLLDYRGRQDDTGKPRATDFREACATLPLLLLREELTDEETSFVRRKFGNGVTDDEIDMIVCWMEARGTFDRVEAMAKSHADAALRALDEVPAGQHRDALAAAVDFVLQRNS